ncbi:DUF3455 domain-containing protein [Amycolatopsis pithecellobii]|uniref:DUF3455 domain-containing protein n=1 Tax=Amycolatopsis pithecellobii TaxID=664692 RepID=A0A6N7Z535_9PSEU|nr:DUF3455 domain-containing protein [Amycolatopsis pithecellobii]MTD54476.1 DUF3455 domain-containing protein [Amycolatopsis pithecellobii]
MKFVLPVVALLGVGALALPGLPGGSPATAPASAANTRIGAVAVPGELRVPDGHRLVLTAHVDEGSQVYSCTNQAWALLEPAAVLDATSTQVLHTAGPKWIATADGSAVTGTTVASVPTPGAVPQLLLKSTGNRGAGVFGSVDYVQRLDTVGGVAPAGACTDGALDAVPYSAEYRFYAPGY